MKKLILILLAALFTAGGLMAQSTDQESEVLKTYYAIMNAMVEKNARLLKNTTLPNLPSGT